MGRTWRLLGVALCMGAAMHAFAFEGDEHLLLSNLAYHLALSKAGRCTDVQPSKPECELLDISGAKEISYGTLVEKIDFTLSPGVVFSHVGLDTSLPRNVGELNPNVVPGEFNLKYAYLRSSHTNDAHFQGLLMSEMHHWHGYARYVSESTDNLFAALVANAASDHFLQDFFAPGHLATPRYNLPDPFARGMHDVNNDVGARFSIENFDALEPLLKHLEDNMERFKPQLAAFNITDAQVAQLRSSHQVINLHGDGELRNNPQQALFMALVEAYAIEEVIQCQSTRPGPCARSAFDAYTWKTSTKSADGVYAPVQAGIHFGRYQFEPAILKMYAPVLGITANYEVLKLGQGQLRTSYAVETVPFGVPGSPDYLRQEKDGKPLTFVNLGPSIGYAYVNGPDMSGHGPVVRLIAGFPLIDTNVSLYFRHLHYSTQQNIRDSKWSNGILFDIGFGPLTAHFGIGKDWGYTEDHRLASGRVLTFGLTAAWPISAIPLLKSLESVYLDDRKLPNN